MKKNSKIDSNLICVGSVGKSKGLKGEFRLNSYCLPKENILTYSKLKIEGYDTHSIEYIKSEKNHFIAKLKEINDIESISKLTNSKIYIYKDDLPDLKNNEFYWHELIGMNVVSSISKKLLGKVCEIRNFGSNDILIIRTNDHDHEVLIPFVIDKIIHKIDKDNLTIYAEWETEY
mgnify:FL=1